MFYLRQRLTQILSCSISIALVATSSQLAQAAPQSAPEPLERFAPAHSLGLVTCHQELECTDIAVLEAPDRLLVIHAERSP